MTRGVSAVQIVGSWSVPVSFLPKPNRTLEKHRKRTAKANALRDAYRVVDARDKGRCVVTGRRTVPRHVDPRVRREHHHVRPRSVAPELVVDPDNIVTVCAEAHRLLQSYYIVAESDGRGGWSFAWNSHVRPEDRLFSIRPVRSCDART